MRRPVATPLGLRAAARSLVLLCTATACVAGAGCGGSSDRHPAQSGQTACNGVPGLCSRRLDEVVFPATHNSYAVAEQPGWHFASQTYPIKRQLDEGIRGLLLDVHFGVYDPTSGRVRTDLAAEGSDRNKVSKQLPPYALRLADSLAGRVGLGRLEGMPVPYLCHTLCELGADPLPGELGVIRMFLQQHRRQVLVVVFEDYVPPATIEHAFRQAGLIRFTETLHPGDPMPTLGSLVQSGRRLVVFAEAKGGRPDWYMPAFEWMGDTPLGAAHPGQLSCAANRGQASGRLLLVNHWIPPFPPSPSLNAVIGRAPFLRSRLERCLRERDARGAIVAVDFYERTAAVAVAKALDEQRAG